jgi:hypothetical protein
MVELSPFGEIGLTLLTIIVSRDDHMIVCDGRPFRGKLNSRASLSSSRMTCLRIPLVIALYSVRGFIHWAW